MTEGYSPLLPADRQKETQHRYMLGLYRVLETITSAFPQILFESCSGGGGRFDPGMLYYMPQTWTSDDTDALERMKIQYGTSLVYPASAMGAHVSAVPNHQTGRITPLSLRCQVALGGNFGFELDLAKMTEDELTVARQAVEQVKRYRGLTETGTFWRLCSPFEGRHTAWAFVSEDQREALLCVYQGLCVPNTPPLHLRMKGLNPELTYLLDEGDRCSGAALMVQGVFLPLRGDFSGQVIHLVAE
jgi:alpha-galactosidase